MSKNTNLSFLTDYITADITNGRIGINTPSPTVAFDVTGVAKFSSSVTAAGGLRTTSANGYQDTDGTRTIGVFANVTGGLAGVTTISNHDLGLFTNNSERMRITSGGDVLVGMTSNGGASVTSVRAGLISGQRTVSSDEVLAGWNQATTGDNKFVCFYTEANGTLRGSIDYNRGAGLVRYNVTSDYRLKTDLKQFNGNDILNKVKVYDYQLKETNARVYGVLAHELQEVIPYAVGGVKDGEKMQSVDYSIIVPIMVQAIQELSAEITIISNKIN